LFIKSYDHYRKYIIRTKLRMTENNALIAIAIEMLDSSDSDLSGIDNDEELNVISTERRTRGKRPRIQNYIEVIALYDDKEFKSHFR